MNYRMHPRSFGIHDLFASLTGSINAGEILSDRQGKYVYQGSEEHKFGNKTNFYERDLALILCFVVLLVCCADVGKLLV